MKIKPKRTKRYQPRIVQPDSVAWAVAGVHKMPFQRIDALFVPINAAVTLLKQGKATRCEWNGICQALNIAEALAGLQIGANLLPEIRAGQTALKQIALRMIGKGSATCYASELAAVDESLVMYRAQLKVCTQAELERAIAKVKAAHNSGAMDDIGRLYLSMELAA